MNQISKSFLSPKSVAIVGASESKDPYTSEVFRRILQNMRGFKKFYPVDLSGKLQGCGSKISEIPRDCSILGIALPEPLLAKNLRKVAVKSKSLVIFTPDPLPKTKLEIQKLSKRSLVLGPGSLGVIIKKSGVCLSPVNLSTGGNVTLVIQNDENSLEIFQTFEKAGVGIRMAICTGNAEICPEVVKLLSEDPETSITALCTGETVNGRKIYETIKQLSQSKLVIVAGRDRHNPLFTSAVRQGGARPADSLRQLAGGCKLMATLGIPESVFVLSNSGPLARAICDELKRVGIKLSVPSGKLLAQLKKKCQVETGSGYLELTSLEPKRWRTAMEILEKEGKAAIVGLRLKFGIKTEAVEELLQNLGETKLATAVVVTGPREIKENLSPHQELFKDLESLLAGVKLLSL